MCFIPGVNFYTFQETFPRSWDGEANKWSLRKVLKEWSLGLLSNLSVCESFTASKPRGVTDAVAKILGENLKIYKYTYNIQLQIHMLLTRENLQSMFLFLMTMEYAVLKQSVIPHVILQC